MIPALHVDYYGKQRKTGVASDSRLMETNMQNVILIIPEVIGLYGKCYIVATYLIYM